MKKTLIIAVFVALILSGCTGLVDEKEDNSLSAQLENLTECEKENEMLKTSNNQLRESIQSCLTTEESAENCLTKDDYSYTDPTICTIKECMHEVGKEEVGLATISGYYGQEEKTAWEETQMCDVFTITGGSNRMNQIFVDLFEMGNTVNSLNEDKEPVININMNSLSAEDKAKIENSTAANPVDLVVLRPSSPGRGAVVCESFVIILEVN